MERDQILDQVGDTSQTPVVMKAVGKIDSRGDLRLRMVAIAGDAFDGGFNVTCLR